jgi:two-component system chemotaxis sensor kinase CheA
LRNEPTRMFAELQRLGEFRAQADITRLPSVEEMDAESCYLSWDIEIDGDITRQQLDEVFDWVDSRCKLEFTPRLKPAAVAVAAPAPEPTAATVVAKPAAAGAAAPKAGADAGSIRVATEKPSSTWSANS